MARVRNLKPSFFTNEDLAKCTPYARLCFAGLWGLADREGRLEDRPLRIKAQILAMDAVEVDPLLSELKEHGFILRYEAQGRAFIQVLQFMKHQNPHHREPRSVIPSPESLGLYGQYIGGKAQGHSEAFTSSDGYKASDEPRALGSTLVIPSTQSRAEPGTRNPEPGTQEQKLSATPRENSSNLNGHDLLGEKPAESTKTKRSIVPVQRIVDLYHAKLCPPLPTVEKITPKREGQIRQRWLQDLPDFEAWSAYFDDVLASPFLMGKVPGREGRPP